MMCPSYYDDPCDWSCSSCPDRRESSGALPRVAWCLDVDGKVARNSFSWRTESGIDLSIDMIMTSHLSNIIKFLERNRRLVMAASVASFPWGASAWLSDDNVDYLHREWQRDMDRTHELYTKVLPWLKEELHKRVGITW